MYRALEPYYTKQSITDVINAMVKGEVSSGTKWPRLMADQICQLYDVPVALPTCSGQGALHVALLCANVVVNLGNLFVLFPREARDLKKSWLV